MTKLRLVPQISIPLAETVRQGIVRAHRPDELIQCRCGSREMIEVKTGIVLRKGKPTGGTKQLICLTCSLKGQRVVVIP